MRATGTSEIRSVTIFCKSGRSTKNDPVAPNASLDRGWNDNSVSGSLKKGITGTNFDQAQVMWVRERDQLRVAPIGTGLRASKDTDRFCWACALGWNSAGVESSDDKAVEGVFARVREAVGTLRNLFALYFSQPGAHGSTLPQSSPNQVGGPPAVKSQQKPGYPGQTVGRFGIARVLLSGAMYCA